MGAYIFFKTSSEVSKVNDFLENDVDNKKLMENDFGIFLTDKYDKSFLKEDWFKSCNKHQQEHTLMFQEKNHSKGDFKTSGFCDDEKDKILELTVRVFEKLNKLFKMKYLVNSCSLSLDFTYYTIEQTKRITDNGKLLSNVKDKDYEEKYQSLIKLMKATNTKEACLV